MINTYITKERAQINHLTLYFKELGKEDKQLKVTRRKEIKIREQINEIETKKINKIRNERDITTDNTETLGSQEYDEQLYANKLDNL